MADMSNEQAARVLTKEADGWGDERVLFGTYLAAIRMGAAALREKAERERGRGCAYCVIGRRSPDAEYCSNCGRKLTPALPELANESEEVNPDSHQYVDNDSTNRRKSVKRMSRNLYSETAETCAATQEQPINFCLCANGEEQVVESVSSPPYRANYCGLCGRFIGGDYA
jgi:hypothetical protein